MKFWQAFFQKKVITPAVAILLVIVSVICTLAIPTSAPTQPITHPTGGTPEELYQGAVADAMVAEENEVEPVVAITPDSDQVAWDDQGRVLLLTYHRYPDSYPAGQRVTLDWGPVWTFTATEMVQWYQENQAGVSDWPLRLKQLIGLPPENEYTHFTALWVEPADLVRPAYSTDITQPVTAIHFPQDQTGQEEYWSWFDDNIVWSYYESAYPWTRLGYTYDWADNGQDYGLSEFLIRQGASVQVEFTYTTEEFLDWLAAQEEEPAA